MQQYTYPELNNIIEVCLFASNQALEIKKLLSLFAPNSTVMISREDNNTMSWRATESLNENEVNEYSDGDAVIYAMIDKLIIENILLELKQKYTNTPFELIQTISGYRIRTKLHFQKYINQINDISLSKYQRGLFELLAIIAYKQNVTRAEIEHIKGSSINPNYLNILLERNWVEIVGVKDTPGRPSIFATSKKFLDDLGLRSLNELPKIQDEVLEQLENLTITAE